LLPRGGLLRCHLLMLRLCLLLALILVLTLRL
jgi:hypothetical protein